MSVRTGRLHTIRDDQRSRKRAPCAGLQCYLGRRNCIALCTSRKLGKSHVWLVRAALQSETHRLAATTASHR
jgi:hypothetical protein